MKIVWIVIFMLGFVQVAPVLGKESAVSANPPVAAESTPSESAAPMTDIHDILPPVPAGPDIPWLWAVLIVLGTVALAVMAWWLWKKRRNKRSIVTIVPELPPEMIARQALDQISDVRGMDGKTFYFRLSAIVRQYVSGRFGVGAVEMTTEEFLPCIDQLNTDSDLARRLKQLCRAMDPVKFGAQQAMEKQMETDLFFAREFVQKTTQQVNMEEENGHGEQSAIVPMNDKKAQKQIPHLK